MKKIRSFLATLIAFSCILSSVGILQADASYTVYCSSCGKLIYSDYTYCPYCAHYVSSYSYTPTYGSWSSWSRTPVYASSSRQVETRQVITGYNMVHYGTQEASSPHYRMFRDYSIKKNLSRYGARKSYGEKHFTRYVSASTLSYAKTFAPGTLITGSYGGYQKGTSTAYNFGDDKYVWFIQSPVYVTEYRFRSTY